MWGSRDPILEFWEPLIFRQRLKLETSNSAQRRTVTSNEKNAKLGRKGSCGVHVTQFWHFGTPLIFRQRLKLETSNLARRRTAVNSNKKRKKRKIRSTGVMWGSRDPLLEFWDPLISRKRLKLANFKFGTETDSSKF